MCGVRGVTLALSGIGRAIVGLALVGLMWHVDATWERLFLGLGVFLLMASAMIEFGEATKSKGGGE